MKKITIKLILEKDKRELIWGRVNYDDDLIVESADSQEILERKMRGHLKHFHDLEPEDVEFEIFWEG